MHIWCTFLYIYFMYHIPICASGNWLLSVIRMFGPPGTCRSLGVNQQHHRGSTCWGLGPGTEHDWGADSCWFMLISGVHPLNRIMMSSFSVVETSIGGWWNMVKGQSFFSHLIWDDLGRPSETSPTSPISHGQKENAIVASKKGRDKLNSTTLTFIFLEELLLFLVGGWATPLKIMTSSIGMMRFPIFLGN